MKSPKNHSEVFVFGKDKKHKAKDSKNGIARIGGMWREPSYLHAYQKSVKILLMEATNEDCFDDIGLPAFYLQRHTTELLLKRLLSWIYEIDELNKELGIKNHHKNK